MTQVILASNGNTRWDRDKIFQGSKNIPLDDLGREEARALGRWLKDETIHAVYTSSAFPGQGHGYSHSPTPRLESVGPAQSRRYELWRLG